MENDNKKITERTTRMGLQPDLDEALIRRALIQDVPEIVDCAKLVELAHALRSFITQL